MPSIEGIPSDVALRTGPVLIGNMVGCILYGIAILQLYTYYIAFPNDRTAVKCLVYLIFMLVTTQTVLEIESAFANFAAGFGDMAATRKGRLQGFKVPILTGIVGLLVQSFYAYQIKVVTRSFMITSIIIAIATVQCTAAIVDGVFLLRSGVVGETDNQATYNIIETIWLAGSALCDTVIAVVMSFYLTRVKTGVKPTSILIKRLVRLVIETGSITAAVAIVNLVLFLLVPQYPFHTIPSGCLAKIYANTLMTILNSRIRIIGSKDDSHVITLNSIRASTAQRGTSHRLEVEEATGPTDWQENHHPIHLRDSELSEPDTPHKDPPPLSTGF